VLRASCTLKSEKDAQPRRRQKRVTVGGDTPARAAISVIEALVA